MTEIERGSYEVVLTRVNAYDCIIPLDSLEKLQGFLQINLKIHLLLTKCYKT